MKTVTIGTNDENQRLDKFLGKLMPDAPRSILYKALRKKRIKINGKRVTDGALRLNAGDILELYLNDELFGEKKPALWQTLSPALSVVYEDEHLLVMDKPQGMLSQSETQESLEGHMRAYLFHKGEFDPDTEQTFLPSLCHRIDRNTDGLVLGAKDAESLRILNQKIRDKEIRKFYLCQVEGCPAPAVGEIQGWMKKDESQNKMYFVSEDTPGAAFCHTRYRVLKKGAVSTVEAELLTGRTHQIRAGFARLGCPLLGDVKYGAKQSSRRYQHLTAVRLVFDFTTESGCLEAIKGKELLLPRGKEQGYAAMDRRSE